MAEKYDENRPTLRLGSYCDAWIYYTKNVRVNMHEIYRRTSSPYILAVCRDPLHLIMIIKTDYCISAIIRIFDETRGVVVFRTLEAEK